MTSLNLAPPEHSTIPTFERRPLDIVMLAGSDSVALGIRQIAQRNRWFIHRCATLLEAKRAIANLSPCVVLCEARIGETTWRNVLEYLQSRTTSVPLIVFTHLADLHLWLDVLEAGGHDVVLFPFEERELVHVVSSACRAPKPSGGRIQAEG